jgi:hypothetical protein
MVSKQYHGRRLKSSLFYLTWVLDSDRFYEMVKKALLIFCIVMVIFALVFSFILSRIFKESSETLSWLRREREPHEVDFLEILLKEKKGWEVIVDYSDVRDVEFSHNKFYLATSGGVIVLSSEGKVERVLNSLWGLPENRYTHVLTYGEGVLALSEGGTLLSLRDRYALKYSLQNIGRVTGISKRESGVLLSATSGVFLLAKDKISKLEDIEDVKIAENLLNGLIVGTIHGKVYILSPTFTDSITDIDAVNDFEEYSGVLYIATPLGLERITDDERECLLTGEFITDIIVFRDKICCGTFDGRIMVGEKIFRVGSEEVVINRLKVFDEILYAATSIGVFLFNGEKWSPFYKPTTETPLNYITTIEKSGNEIYIGTFEDGCFSFHSDRLQEINIDEDVNEINHIVKIGNNLCIASNSGLYLLKQKGAVEMEDLPTNFVNGVVSDGKRLVTGTSKGFSVFDLVKMHSKNYGSFQGLINNRVYAVEFFEGRIVLGTLGGISIFDGKSFRNYTSANSPLKANWINCLLSVNERMYIGTYGGGIAYLDKEGITVIEDSKETEINHNCIFYKNPFLLAGTVKNGLFVYNEKENRGRFLKGYFPRDDVTAVFIDDEFFYIGTEQGLYIVEAKEMPL